MNKVLLMPKFPFKVPVEAETITPDNFEGKSLEEIGGFEVWEGHSKVCIKDLFELKEESSEISPTVELIGDFSKVRLIGKGMGKGVIMVKGSVGMHLGERMCGGRIVVEGSVGSWLGGMMKDGMIEVFGNVGDCVGAPYRGGVKGMRGGSIIVHGNAGYELGYRMRDGFIQVDGNVGQFAGAYMGGGTVYIKGQVGGRLGACMRDGRIVALGNIPSILPSFTIDDIRATVKVGNERIKGPFYLFQGDLNEAGNGRLFIFKDSNTHLSIFEKYLE